MPRPAICLGTDPYHTSTWIIDTLSGAFRSQGLEVAVDRPYAGCIVPLDFWHLEQHVLSIMVEVRRDLYMDEASGEVAEGFGHIEAAISHAINALRVTIQP